MASGCMSNGFACMSARIGRSVDDIEYAVCAYGEIPSGLFRSLMNITMSCRTYVMSVRGNEKREAV